MSGFRQWIIQVLGGSVKTCNHRWTVLIEHYPTFTQDYWQCTRCKFTKAYQNESPPAPIKTDVCSLGHIHIIN